MPSPPVSGGSVDPAGGRTPLRSRRACDPPGPAACIRVSGRHAFVADYSAGLQVIDIGEPASPVLVGACDTPGYAGELAVSGTLVFVADEGSGLQVIDVSDPAAPRWE